MSKKDEKTTVAEIEADVLDEIRAEAPKSRFAKLAAEAMKDYTPAEPYPFDADEDNIVYVTKPDTTERALALASIVDADGNVDLEMAKPMLYSLLGESFDPVWAVIRNMPIEVTIALVQDIQDWFFPNVNTDDVKATPGGTADSSS